MLHARLAGGRADRQSDVARVAGLTGAAGRAAHAASAASADGAAGSDGAAATAAPAGADDGAARAGDAAARGTRDRSGVSARADGARVTAAATAAHARCPAVRRLRVDAKAASEARAPEQDRHQHRTSEHHLSVG